MTTVAKLVGLGLGITLLGSTPGAADLAKWDQAVVTGIAKQLPDATERLQNVLRDEPAQTIGSGDTESFLGLQQQARRLHEQGTMLDKHLQAGKGHDETLDYYRTFREVWDDTMVNARRSELPEPTMDAFARVEDLLRQLAPYYDPKASVDPNAPK
jgi:hypothetical protein